MSYRIEYLLQRGLGRDRTCASSTAAIGPKAAARESLPWANEPKNLRDSSAKYGACEVCGSHVSEMHLRTLDRGYDAFGHRECLLGATATLTTTDEGTTLSVTGGAA
jgi:hypothetical protein